MPDPTSWTTSVLPQVAAALALLIAGVWIARWAEGARTGLVELDHMSDDDLELVRQEFSRMRDKYAPLVDDDLANVERELKARKRRS